jgi:uncharacterized protein YabN with tetrapyrrole methylase and pyrophosphatase domain
MTVRVSTAHLQRGSLIVVGTGIRAVGQITLEADGAIREADKVYYVVADPLTANRIRELNGNAEDLYRLYGDNKPRIKTYNEMTDQVVATVRSGLKVCFAFYGHPGIFVNSSHRAISILRSEGYSAEMLPGISSIDCLIADLGIDPSRSGLQMFDATDVLLRNRKLDTTCGVVLWQIGCVGDGGFRFQGYDCRHFPRLVEYLKNFYGPDHNMVLYVAAQYSIVSASIEVIALQELDKAKVTGISTLFIPPKDNNVTDHTLLRYFQETDPSLNSETPKQG